MYKILNSTLWPIKDPTIIQLYSLATPNGRKVAIALEELEIPYEAHRVILGAGQQFESEFLEISPNNKIPAIVDPDGPDGNPLALMESAVIIRYLAEKAGGKLIPKDPRLQWECRQWMFFQMASLGPMFGQFGHFYKFAKENCNHPYPLERYETEAKRILSILDKRLENRAYVVDDEFTIADICCYPWVGCLEWGYGAKDYLKLSDYTNVTRWYEACYQRPAVQKGETVCPLDH